MSSKNKSVIVNSRKFDGSIHRSWKAELIEETESRIVLLGEFETEVKHLQLGVIRRGTISYEFFWKNRTYNIFRFHEPDGNLRNFYCNICLPPNFQVGVLDYVDLDVDVLVWKDSSFEKLDEDEFETNSLKYKYPGEVRRIIDRSFAEIIRLIEQKKFPFDFKL